MKNDGFKIHSEHLQTEGVYLFMENTVFIARTLAEYPKFPYDDQNHPMYRSLRGIFQAWGKDADNPFADILNPGDVVVIKPNLVINCHQRGYNIESLITHPSLIKYAIDFAARALGGKGKIIIGDAPLQTCDFQKLVEVSRIRELLQLARAKYRGIDFELEDWRLTIMDKQKDISLFKGTSIQARVDDYDTAVRQKFALVDLGTNSFLDDISDFCDKFRVICYKKSPMLSHHTRGKHEYLITNRIQQAKLMINLPKMKTHIKAGLTGALKNLVGINGHKEFLPHHIRGAYFKGGDCYCRSHVLRSLQDRFCDYVWEHYMEMPAFKRVIGCLVLDVLSGMAWLTGGDSISAGSWSGNETVWRTILDLNHIVYFSKYSPGHVLTIVDGVIAGEGEGPLIPTPKPAGTLVAGENPAYIDAVIAKIIGYNISRIPTVHNAIYDRRSKFAGPFLSGLKIVSLLDGNKSQLISFDDLPNLNFTKPRYWQHADVASKG